MKDEKGFLNLRFQIRSLVVETPFILHPSSLILLISPLGWQGRSYRIKHAISRLAPGLLHHVLRACRRVGHTPWNWESADSPIDRIDVARFFDFAGARREDGEVDIDVSRINLSHRVLGS